MGEHLPNDVLQQEAMNRLREQLERERAEREAVPNLLKSLVIGVIKKIDDVSDALDAWANGYNQ